MKSILKIFISLFLLGFLFTSCSNGQKIIAKKGIIDLSNEPFSKIGIVDLSGEWEFYWTQLLSPADFTTNKPSSPLYAKIPSSWQSVITNEINTEAQGYATYRLLVKTNPQDSIFMIRINRIDLAYKLWINGDFITAVGKISDNNTGYEPKWSSNSSIFHSKKTEQEIIIQVSNFDFVRGGIVCPIQLSNIEELNASVNKEIGLDFLLLGIMLVIALYHVVLYILRRQVISSLYFAILSFFASALVIISSEFDIVNLFWPGIAWIAQIKLEYIFYFSALIFLVLFISSLFKLEAKKLYIKIVVGYAALMILVVTLSPVSVFMSILSFAEWIFIIIVLYLNYIVYKAIVNQKEGASKSIVGLLFLTLAIINDILVNKYSINGLNLLPFGFLIFMLIQAYIISSKFIEAIKFSEQLTEEMDYLNNNLENIVKDRTSVVELQKEELLVQSESLKVANDEIIKINHILERQGGEMNKKNKALTDSLNYAKRLQTAVLPDPKYLEEVLPEHFILYMPKDIVSGDFYWYGEVDSSWDFDDASSIQVLIAADCTGHGVPGAFMTLLGHNFLNVTVKTQEVTDPEQIIYKLDQQVVETLRQNDPTSIKDGMDISVLSIEQDKNIISFAGAGSPLYYFKNGEFNEIKGANFGIGGVLRKEKVFEPHKLEYEAGDVFYIFSDGYPDQIGGKEGRKFYKKRFKELLEEINGKPMAEQKKLLEENFFKWKGDYKQIDDILVIGLRM